MSHSTKIQIITCEKTSFTTKQIIIAYLIKASLIHLTPILLLWFHYVFFFAEASSLIKEDFLEFSADTLSAWFLGSSYFSSSSSISISAASFSCISFSSYYSNSYYRFSSYKRSALDSFVIPKSYPLKLDNFKVCSLARWRIVIKHDCIDTRLALSPKSLGNSCITPVNWIYSISSLLLDFLADEVRYF